MSGEQVRMWRCHKGEVRSLLWCLQVAGRWDQDITDTLLHLQLQDTFQ